MLYGASSQAWSCALGFSTSAPNAQAWYKNHWPPKTEERLSEALALGRCIYFAQLI